MVDLASGLVAYLNTQTAVTAVVGNRIQPLPSPQVRAGFPCLVYQVVSDTPQDYTLSGAAGLTQSHILISCLEWFGPGSYSISHGLALTLKDALSGFSGTFPNGTKIFFVEVDSISDVFQSDALLSSANIHLLVTYQDD
jgi:hypothetical protein